MTAPRTKKIASGWSNSDQSGVISIACRKSVTPFYRKLECLNISLTKGAAIRELADYHLGYRARTPQIRRNWRAISAPRTPKLSSSTKPLKQEIPSCEYMQSIQSDDHFSGQIRIGIEEDHFVIAICHSKTKLHKTHIARNRMEKSSQCQRK